MSVYTADIDKKQFNSSIDEIQQRFTSEHYIFIKKLNDLRSSSSTFQFMPKENIEFLEEFISLKYELEGVFNDANNEIGAFEFNGRFVIVRLSLSLENLTNEIIDYVFYRQYQLENLDKSDANKLFNHDSVLKFHILSQTRISLMELLQDHKEYFEVSQTYIKKAYQLNIHEVDTSSLIKLINESAENVTLLFKRLKTYQEHNNKANIISLNHNTGNIFGVLHTVNALIKTYTENTSEMQQNLLVSRLSSEEQFNEFRERINEFKDALNGRSNIKIKVVNYEKIFIEMKNRYKKMDENKIKIPEKIIKKEKKIKYTIIIDDSKNRMDIEQINVLKLIRKVYGDNLMKFKEYIMEMELYIDVFYTEIMTGYLIFSFDKLVEEVCGVLNDYIKEVFVK